jgi:hypothetical protein
VCWRPPLILAAAAPFHRARTVTRILPPALTTKPRTLAAWKGTDAGYHAAWPAVMVQPPAVTSCPRGPVTSSWHRVPAATPVTCTSSSVPHGRDVYRTAAQAPVPRFVPSAVTAHWGAAAAGVQAAAGFSACSPAAAANPASAAAAAVRHHLRRIPDTHQGSGGVRRQPQGLPDGYPAEQGRQPREPGEFGTARRARRQVAVHQGTLGRLDRAEQIHAEFLTGLRALAVVVHVRRPVIREWP